jgi:hypothetical protein
LCADGIKLDLQERRRNSIPYEMVPALKIARLAIDKKFQKHGLANFMIRYAVYKLLVMRKEMCGVKFMTLDCFPHRLKYYKDIGFIENQTRVENGENDRPISMRLVIEDFLEKNKITPPTF